MLEHLSSMYKAMDSISSTGGEVGGTTVAGSTGNISDSVGLGWILRICISASFCKDNAAI